MRALKTRARSLRPGRAAVAPEITLTPLIDVILTLLVIFMMTAPMRQNTINVDLPTGSSKGATEGQELVVSMRRDGTVYVNNDHAGSEVLTQRLIDAIRHSDHGLVFVRADKLLPYGQVISMVEMLKQSGARRVALAIEVMPAEG